MENYEKLIEQVITHCSECEGGCDKIDKPCATAVIICLSKSLTSADEVTAEVWEFAEDTARKIRLMIGNRP